MLAYAATAPAGATTVFILPAGTTSLPDAATADLPAAARQYVHDQLAAGSKLVSVNHFSHQHYFVVAADKAAPELTAEALRRSGHQLHALLKSASVAAAYFVDLTPNGTGALPLAEGVALTAYQFAGYKTDEQARQAPQLAHLYLTGPGYTAQLAQELHHVLEGVVLARDLVNAPYNKLNATQLADRMAEAGEAAGFTTEILDLARIEALRMGGLLAVNQGSTDPPTFTIMEYKPANATKREALRAGRQGRGIRHGRAEPEAHAQQHGPDEVRHGRGRRRGGHALRAGQKPGAAPRHRPGAGHRQPPRRPRRGPRRRADDVQRPHGGSAEHRRRGPPDSGRRPGLRPQVRPRPWSSTWPRLPAAPPAPSAPRAW